MSLESLQPEFAQSLVARRLREVRRRLRSSCKQWKSEPEHVHQLRVATRRAETTLRTLAVYFDSPTISQMIRWLKRVRRAASAARDLDVLNLRYKNASELKIAQRDRVIKLIDRHREKSQRALAAVGRKEQRRQVRELGTALLQAATTKESPAQALSSMLLNIVRPLGQKFFDIVEQGVADIEQIHRLRILGKRIRYTLEVFAGAFPNQAVPDLLRTFKEMQESFGRLNDHAVAAGLFQRWAEKIEKKKLRRLLNQLAQCELAEMNDRFDQIRASWNRANWQPLEAKFDALLQQK